MDKHHEAIDTKLVARVTEQLSADETPDETIDALDQFGSLMMEEVLGRVAVIESKSISLLGWSTALLGFLLLDDLNSTDSLILHPAVPYLLGTAIFCALLSLAAAFVGCYAREWAWPGVKHWFCERVFSKPRSLRVVHLKALLESHQVHSYVLKQKGLAVQVSQWTLVVAAVLVAVRLALRT